VLPIADRHLEYARMVTAQLAAAGLRVELDDRQEKIGYKIRSAQLQKVPYMLVVGDREQAESTVSVRHRSGGDLGAKRVEEFVEAARVEIREKGAPDTVGPAFRSGVSDEATKVEDGPNAEETPKPEEATK
jgi:threonyl-tRNA synthetase